MEELTAFLAQLFGGPGGDTQRRWWLSLRESHQRFRIRQEDREAWMENMVLALNDAQIAAPLRGALCEFFADSSAHVVNQGEAVRAASEPGGPPGGDDAIQREIGWRWEAQCELDEAVSAVRRGEG